MNKRGFGLITIIIVAVVAGVVGAMFSAGVLGVFGLSPPGISNAFVNAHECTRDGTCEVNRLESVGDVVIGGDLTLNGAYNVECDSFPRSGSESGEETCLNNGYNYCLIAEYSERKSYLDSTDSSCDGEIQAEFVRPFLGVCPGAGGGGGAACFANDNGAEPFLGDVFVSSGSSDIDIVCCR